MPILHKVFDFYKLFNQHLQLFPKRNRLTLGRKIDSLILEIIELIFLALNSEKKEKTIILRKASLKIDLLKIVIRLAKETKALDNKKYILLQKELQEIGKMLGGWIRAIGR